MCLHVICEYEMVGNWLACYQTLKWKSIGEPPCVTCLARAQTEAADADDDLVDDMSEEEVEGENEEDIKSREARQRLRKEAQVTNDNSCMHWPQLHCNTQLLQDTYFASHTFKWKHTVSVKACMLAM